MFTARIVASRTIAAWQSGRHLPGSSADGQTVSQVCYGSDAPPAQTHQVCHLRPIGLGPVANRRAASQTSPRMRGQGSADGPALSWPLLRARERHYSCQFFRFERHPHDSKPAAVENFSPQRSVRQKGRHNQRRRRAPAPSILPGHPATCHPSARTRKERAAKPMPAQLPGKGEVTATSRMLQPRGARISWARSRSSSDSPIANMLLITALPPEISN